jgi:hypothetical protein
MGALSTVLSLLGVLVYILVIIAIAAALTWAVVRLVPAKTKPAPQKTSSR